jgi:3-dehydrosphinganine reductase
MNAMIRSLQPPNTPKRKIVFTASLLSFTAMPGYAAYAPAKAAIRMLADTLREECLLYDIDVHCSFPAGILSPGWDEEEKTKPEITRKLEGPGGAESPETVAKAIIDRLERGHKHITYEFVGTMLKVHFHTTLLTKNMMQGMTERDNAIWDSFTGILGSIIWPVVRFDWRRQIRAYKAEHASRVLPAWP